MRAVVHDRYGAPDVLRLADVERPVQKDGEILVWVHATTVNRTDCHRRAADPVLWRLMTGLRRPRERILGMEFAGVVEAVGATVTEFAAGDRVFGIKGVGAHAELVTVRARGLVARMPEGLRFEEAAAVCDGALNALSCLRRIDARPGRTLIVYGASGSVGTACVQLARHFGADVTAVCNTKNVELVRSLGADRVIDYTQEDFTRNGETYDAVVDAVGKLSFRRCKRSLKPAGIYVATDHLRNLVLAAWTSRIGSKRVVMAIPRHTSTDVAFLAQLVEAGEYRPVIDRCYPLQDVVEAARYVETQQKTGNVVLTL